MVPRMEVFFSDGVPCGVLALIVPVWKKWAHLTRQTLTPHLTRCRGRKGPRTGCRREAGTRFCISLSQGQSPRNIHQWSPDPLTKRRELHYKSLKYLQVNSVSCLVHHVNCEMLIFLGISNNPNQRREIPALGSRVEGGDVIKSNETVSEVHEGRGNFVKWRKQRRDKTRELDEARNIFVIKIFVSWKKKRDATLVTCWRLQNGILYRESDLNRQLKFHWRDWVSRIDWTIQQPREGRLGLVPAQSHLLLVDGVSAALDALQALGHDGQDVLLGLGRFTHKCLEQEKLIDGKNWPTLLQRSLRTNIILSLMFISVWRKIVISREKEWLYAPLGW